MVQRNISGMVMEMQATLGALIKELASKGVLDAEAADALAVEKWRGLADAAFRNSFLWKLQKVSDAADDYL
jgi:hypothetical protein